jgi:glycerophosphoryl diester phosphodiesterase
MSGRPLIIAHRGASAFAPENTFAAFSEAIECGADGIEFDVRLARDGVPVVFHDEDLKRIAGRNEKISALTSSELADVDVGTWFNRTFPQRARSEYTKERIRTLADTLELLSVIRGRIYVELKCTTADAGDLAMAVCDQIRDSALLPHIIVKSFTLDALPHVQRLCPSVRTAALFEPTAATVLNKQKNIIEPAIRSGADELSLHYSLATRRLMDKASRLGKPVTVWTVDKPRWLAKAEALGIKALITNDPSLLIGHIIGSNMPQG